MCNQQSLRSACAYAQSDQSLCSSLAYSMSGKAALARLSLNLSKCHIVENHMLRLIYDYYVDISDLMMKTKSLTELKILN